MTRHIDKLVVEKVEILLSHLSLDQKIHLMQGQPDFLPGMQGLIENDDYHKKPFVAGELAAHDIHGVRFIDGPRGVVLEGGATTFPVPMARGASFDVEMERDIGRAIGKEHRVMGGNLFGGVCINLLRHPAWGRAQETYGEDSILLGEMGANLVLGVQEQVMACAKHFAVNSIENARFKVDVQVSKRALHEVYLPHFKRTVDVGVACIMSAYNALNGEWCGQNKHLLRDILKQRWGFKGYVITDFIFGMRNAKLAALAGQDIELPFKMHYARFLKQLVQKREVPETVINEAARRILQQQLSYQDRPMPPRDVLACEAHTTLARNAARKSVVLLKNKRSDGQAILPLEATAQTTLAVIGRLADQANLGDHGSSDGRPDYVITPLAGIRNAKQDSSLVSYHNGDDVDAAYKLAAQSDYAIVTVGYTYQDEGEYIAPISMEPFADGIAPPPWLDRITRIPPFNRLWRKFVGYVSRKRAAQRAQQKESVFGLGGDRASLSLSKQDESLIQAVAEVNPNTIVMVMAGSAVTMDAWYDKVAAVMMIWYPGMEGGNGIADVLFGHFCPSARLPFVVPKTMADLPVFDSDAEHIEYGLWHGYKKLAREGNTAFFPFGFGLSYAEFTTGTLMAEKTNFAVDSKLDAAVTLQFAIENLSSFAADKVWQLYCSMPSSMIERAPRSLVGFGCVQVAARASLAIETHVVLQNLAYYDEQQDCFKLEKGEYQLFLAEDSQAEASALVTIHIE